MKKIVSVVQLALASSKALRYGKEEQIQKMTREIIIQGCRASKEEAEEGEGLHLNDEVRLKVCFLYTYDTTQLADTSLTPDMDIS